VKAGIIIHNAGLNRLVKLVGAENLPAEYLARLRSAVPADVAAIILGTKKDLLDEKHSLLHSMGWERTLNCYTPRFSILAWRRRACICWTSFGQCNPHTIGAKNWTWCWPNCTIFFRTMTRWLTCSSPCFHRRLDGRNGAPQRSERR